MASLIRNPYGEYIYSAREWIGWSDVVVLPPSHCCILHHHLPVTIHNKSPSSALKGYTAEVTTAISTPIKHLHPREHSSAQTKSGISNLIISTKAVIEMLPLPMSDSLLFQLQKTFIIILLPSERHIVFL